MKKEKLFTLFFAAMLFACNVNAKKKLYLNAGIGYAFPAASQSIGKNQTSKLDENVYGSFGKGFNFGAGIGLMFNNYIGAEVGLSYLAGASYDLYDKQDDVLLYSVNGNMFRIIPAVKITGGEIVKPYAKFGFIFGTGTQVKAELSGMQGTSAISGTQIYSEGFSSGLLGAFGIDFKSVSKLSFFAEFAVIAQSWKPDKYVSTTTTSNGNNSNTQVDSWILVDNLPSSATGQKLVTVQPFSSFGINAGIKFVFKGGK